MNDERWRQYLFLYGNGNQTTRVIGVDTYTVIYDAENRLVEVKKNNLTMATFVYDGDGRRVPFRAYIAK